MCATSPRARASGGEDESTSSRRARGDASTHRDARAAVMRALVVRCDVDASDAAGVTSTHVVRGNGKGWTRAVVVDAREAAPRARGTDAADARAREAREAVRAGDVCFEGVETVARALGWKVGEVARADAAVRAAEGGRGTRDARAPAVMRRSVVVSSRGGGTGAAEAAHAAAVRTIRSLCGGTGRVARPRAASEEQNSRTHVLIDERADGDEDASFSVAITTRHVVRTAREYRPRWRRWLPRGAHWTPNAGRASTTSSKKVVEVVAVTVAEPIVASVDWQWPFLDTGSAGDGLMHVACARSDGREAARAAVVDVVDARRLSDSLTFTYEELFDLAVRAAEFMRDTLGVRPGDVVGVLSGNSHEVYVLHHACAMVRATLLNLNTHLVARELSYITRDSKCRFVFARTTHSEVINQIMESRDRQKLDSVVWIANEAHEERRCLKFPRAVRNFDWSLDVTQHESNSRALLVYDRALAAQTVAHLYYTSGTTGNPKGVSLTHEIVRAHARATGREMRLHHSDVWLHAAPMFHLVDAFAIYSITDVGARHVFLRTFEASALLRVIALERVTVSNLASSMVTILAHNPMCEVCDLSSLRMMSCGGSPLPATAVARAISLFGCEFFVSYGMTECCGKISMSILTDEFRASNPPEVQLDAICTSGRPFSLMSVKITKCDNPNESVPSDGKTVGEVRVRGPTVFSGYLNNPEATLDAFDDEGWFLTGDLGVMRPDGFITIVDRAKDMILCGGENVYCVEVERVLHANDYVKQAAVFGVPHPIMGESVHAAVTLRDQYARLEDVHDAERALLTHCAEHLSQYKCPSEIHVIESLPMNASGKILKRELRELCSRSALKPTRRSRTTSGEIKGAETYVSTLLPVESVPTNEPKLRGERWLVIGKDANIVETLRHLGADVRIEGGGFDIEEDWIAQATRYRSLLRSVINGDTIVLADCLRCYDVLATSEHDMPQRVTKATFASAGLVLALVRAIESIGLTDVRVVVLTSNAFVASDDSPSGAVIHAPIASVVRVLRREHPSIEFAVLDTPARGETTQGGLYMALERMFTDDKPLAERDFIVGRTHTSVPRLLSMHPPIRGDSAELSFIQDDQSCVLFGGLGALGLLHVKFLMTSYDARRFVLVGRTVSESMIENARHVASSSKVSVDIVSADCCDANQTFAIFALAEPVAMTFHLAGVLSEGAAIKMTRSRFVSGSEAKVIGSLNVFEELSNRRSLLAVCSTSIFGHLGQPMLASYAAANAFQDALCAVKRTEGREPRRIVAIQWGTWDEDGMAVRSGAAFRAYWINMGMGFINPLDALAFVGKVITAPKIRPSVACFPPTDWWRFFEASRTVGTPPAFIEAFVSSNEHFIQKCDKAQDLSSRSSSGAPLDESVLITVCRVSQEVLGDRPIDADASLFSAGLTSTRAVQLSEKLSKVMKCAVPTTLAFDYPTLRQLSQYFAPKTKVLEPAIEPQSHNQAESKLFILASAGFNPESSVYGNYPKGGGGDAISVVPTMRWDVCQVNEAGKLLCGFGGFILEAGMFDSTLFNVSSAEACIIDPQQRLVLRAVAALPKSKPCARVHVGVSQIEHPRVHFDKGQTLSPYYATSAHLSVVAGRVSYVFALSGCAEAIDTACSSSLVAVHHCVASHDDAFAGGVNLTIDVTWSLACHAASMLSSDGRCKTLDAAADGYVRAESCMMTLLSPSRSNVQLHGAAVNQDGRSSTLTAPNGPSQTKVILAAYEDNREILCISLHGTGTPLGDPIEIGALRAAVDGDEVVRVFAAKSVLGHSEPASGLASLLLATDALQASSSIFATHVRAVNPHLTSCDDNLDLMIPRERSTMSFKTASASAFAFQGTNAHAVVRMVSNREMNLATTRTTALANLAPRWLARTPHGWIKTGEVAPWGGRVVFTAKLVGALGSAMLLDHIVHGKPIAPGTALLELFIESFSNGAPDKCNHGREVVIPHAMQLTPEPKTNVMFARVIVRRHDGRISVTSGPLCRPHTHLYGRADRATPVASTQRKQSAAAFRISIKRQLLANITRQNHSTSMQSGGANVNAHALDAAIHLAEGVLQFDGTHSARVPAALESMFCEYSYRDEVLKEEKSSQTVCAMVRNALALRGERARHDHRLQGTSLRRLDIRPPLGSRVKASPRQQTTGKRNTYAAISLSILPGQGAHDSKVSKQLERSHFIIDDARCAVGSFVQHLTVPFICKVEVRTSGSSSCVFDVPSALMGAARCAAHELVDASILCADSHFVARKAFYFSAEDAWVSKSLSHGAVTSMMISTSECVRDGCKSDFRLSLKPPSPSKSDVIGSLVVYGGTGALGARMAQDFSKRNTNRRVVLIGRIGRATRKFSFGQAIAKTVRLDAATLEDSHVAQKGAVQSHVAYASGVLADASLQSFSAGSLHKTYASKLSPVRDWLSASGAPGCRVFFSSATAFVGNAGQVSYGAVNASLDRRASKAGNAGVRAVSLQWGAFAGGGMASGVEARMIRIGIGLLSPHDVMETVHSFLTYPETSIRVLCVGAFDWQAYGLRQSTAFKSPFFRNVLVGDPSRALTQSESYVDLRSSSKPIDVRKVVSEVLKSVIGRDVTQDAPFFEIGLDSISSVEFVSSLETALDRRLPATLVFDYPTPKALAAHIEADHTTQRLEHMAALDYTQKLRYDDRTTDTIMCADADVPGERVFNCSVGASTWRADDRVSVVTRDRWDVEARADVPRFAGFYRCDGWQSVDSHAFGFQMNELFTMDPQQRATLHHASCAFRLVSGCETAHACGVFIGAATNDYKSVVVDAGAFTNPFVSTGCAFVSVIAGRISYVLNLSGTSVAIDTACSSALCALHLGRANSSSKFRMVGGVNALFNVETSLMFSLAGMLANDGRCKTFDLSADGYARAETCALMLLRRDCYAQAARTLAVDGSALTQDGRSSSLTAPNGPSQACVIRAAAAMSGMPRTIASLHGTGTPLGDPIEIGAAMDARDDDVQVISLIATKASLAHSESPSGLVGLFAAASSLRSSGTAPVLHLRNLNPYVERALGGASCATSRLEAAVSNTSAAGASAFAFQGTNAHGVIILVDDHVTAFWSINRIAVRSGQHSWPLVVSPTSLSAPMFFRETHTVRFEASPSSSILDHRVRDRPVLPGAAYLSLTARLSETLAGNSLIMVEAAAFHAPMVLTVEISATLSVVLSRGRARFSSTSSRVATFASARLATQAPRSNRFCRCALSSEPGRSRDNAVAGSICHAPLLDESTTWAEIDASFHFLAATWSSNSRTLRVPSSADVYCYSRGRCHQAPTGAASIGPAFMSDHSTRSAVVFGLRTSSVNASPARGERAVTLGTYFLNKFRREAVGPEPPTKSTGRNYAIENSVLAAMQMPTFFEFLKLTPSCSMLGIVAALRSSAMETRSAARIRVVGADWRFISRWSSEQISTRREYELDTFTHRHRPLPNMLIFGGAGALGQHITSYFGSNDFKRVVWTTTTGRACDMTSGHRDRELCVTVNDSVKRLCGAPDLVIRASGVLADASMANVGVRDVRAVIAAKCSVGVRVCDFHVPVQRDRALTSIAGMIGSLGQAAYAAANEIMDSRCETRSHSGVDAKSFQFGPWSGAGMGEDNVLRARLKTLGISYADPLDVLAATRALTMRVDAPVSTCLVAMDWTAYALATNRVGDELFMRVVDKARVEKVETWTPKEKPSSHTSTTSLMPSQTLERIIECVERATGLKPNAETPFMNSGVDSVTSMELSSELARTFAMTLPATFLFDHPTPQSAATFITATHPQDKGDSRLKSSKGLNPVSKNKEGGVFIDGRFAAQSIPEPLDFSRTVPHKKWRVDDVSRERMPARFMNSMGNIEVFDTDSFGVRSDEARRIDCQQRLALVAALIAVDATGTALGVFLGIASRDYADIIARDGSRSTSTFDAVSSFGSVASGRISFVFNFTGPACSIDTACSSALVATHQSRIEMSTGRISTALTGGINVILHPRVTEQFNRAGMLALSGRCQTLDSAADGYVRAESCSLLRLVSGNGTIKHGMATLRSSAVNQDGRSSALTAPNGPSQRDVVSACHRDSLGSELVMHLHGTGTPLGDPIEVNALASLASEASLTDLDASKSWFGHAETASGAVSMTFLMTELTARRAWGLRNLADMNPYIVTSAGRIRTFRGTAPREHKMCGASSFAFQGSNAHVGVNFDSNHISARLDARQAIDARRTWCEPRVFESLVCALSAEHDDFVRLVSDIRVIVGVEDHRVRGRALFPGAGMMHIVACAGILFVDQSTLCVKATIPSSIEIDGRENRSTLKLSLSCGSCELVARSRACFKARIRSTTAFARRAFIVSQPLVEASERARAAHPTPTSPELAYECFRSTGLEYGPRFRILRAIRRGSGHSQIAIIAAVHGALKQIAALDGTMQLAAPTKRDAVLAIPVGAKVCFGGITNVARSEAYAEISRGTPTNHLMSSLDKNSCSSCIRSLRAKALRECTPFDVLSSKTSMYVAERCAKPRGPESYFGTAVHDFARISACYSESVVSSHRAGLSTQIIGVNIDYALGLAKSTASELDFTKFARASESRGHESFAIEERLEYLPKTREARPRNLARAACRPKTDNVHIIGAFGALGLIAAKTLREDVLTVNLSSRVGRGHFDFSCGSTIKRAMAHDAAIRCPISGIIERRIFVSGIIEDGLISSLSAMTFRAVFAPKSNAALAARDHASILSSMYFSSIASLLGSSGQANYAAANGSVDFIARAQRQSGLIENTLQFGPWAEGGMATRQVNTLRRLCKIGIGALRAVDGLAMLRMIVNRAVVCVARLDVKSLASSALHLSSELLRDHATMGVKPRVASAGPTKREALHSSSVEARDIEAKLTVAVTNVLGVEISSDDPLMQSGLDSLAAVDLTNAVSSIFGLELPSTVFFDHPTIFAASKEIWRLRGGVSEESPLKTAIQTSLKRRSDSQSLIPHVVAHAGEMETRHFDRDSVRLITLDRNSQMYDGSSNRFCGFCATVEQLAMFDSSAFGPTNSMELIHLDPRQRLLLHSATVCSVALMRFPGESEMCGVFIGCSGKDYSRLLECFGIERGAFQGIGNESSVVSGRLSFVFALRGPSLSIDTACSSSLCATSMALGGFERGTITRAYVAGASLVLTDDMHRVLGGAGMLSASGRSRAFDAAADGYGRGEGAELLVVATDADGAGALAILPAGVINQDGRSSSLTAPSGTSQQDVIEISTRLADANNGNHEDKVVHTHGTGTALGDPIEANAALRALARHLGARSLQATKSHAGHAEPAAGIVTLVVAISQIHRDRSMSGICHLRRANEHAKFDGAFVPRIRCSSIFGNVNVHASAFAFQGTNAHVISAPTHNAHGVVVRLKLHVAHSCRYWPSRTPSVKSVAISGLKAIFEFVEVHQSSSAFAFASVIERASDDIEFAIARFVEASSDKDNRFCVILRATVVRSSAGAIAYPRRFGSAVTQSARFRAMELSDLRKRLLKKHANPQRVSLCSGRDAVFASPSACEWFRFHDGRDGLTVGLETCKGVIALARDGGARAFTALGISRRIVRTSRLSPVASHLVTYTFVQSDEVDTELVDSRVAATAMMLAQTPLGLSCQMRSIKLGSALRVIFRCHDSAKVRVARRMLQRLHLGSVPEPNGEPRSGLILGGTGALGRIIRAKLIDEVTLSSRVGRSRHPQLTTSFTKIEKTDCSFREYAALGRCTYDLAIHAAGVLADAALQNQTREHMSRVFAPKIIASANAYASESPCQRVLFSSIAALVAPAGQANYACACAALDAFAECSRLLGEATSSVRWGAFEIGMADDAHVANRDLSKYGIKSLSIEAGLGVLESIISGVATPAVFVASPLCAQKVSEADFISIPEQKTHSLNSNAAEIIGNIVRDLIGRTLERSEPMMAAGLDSVASLELRNELERTFQVHLPSTIAFDYPTVEAMSKFVSEICEGEMHTTTRVIAHSRAADSYCLYACSKSGRFFTGDDDLAVFHPTSSSSTSIVPTWRWHTDDAHYSELPVRFVAFLSAIDVFDREVFAVSSPEAIAMDPQQRGVLERVFACVPTDFGTNVGVYIGIQHFEYALIGEEHGVGPHDATGRALSVCPGRVSYVFGFTASSLAVDTACSASLTALHLALHDYSHATAHACGGVNYVLTRKSCAAIQAAGMLALDGRCKTLDASADGYGRGEAVACIMLSRECRAAIFVLCSSACESDGRSSSLTAPNGPAQRSVIAEAWRILDLDDVVSDVSMHGTGTALGDPIECSSLGDVARHRSFAGCITLSASKSAVAHTESTAGSAGVFYLAARFAAETAPPIIGLTRLNPHVLLSHTFRAPLQRIAAPRQPRGDALVTGCSAFAFMGTNVHVVLRGSSNSSRSRTFIVDSRSHWPILIPTRYHVSFLSERVRNVVEFRVLKFFDESFTASTRLASECARACQCRQTAASTLLRCMRSSCADESLIDVTVSVRMLSGQVQAPELGAGCHSRRFFLESHEQRSTLAFTSWLRIARSVRLIRCGSASFDPCALSYGERTHAAETYYLANALSDTQLTHVAAIGRSFSRQRPAGGGLCEVVIECGTKVMSMPSMTKGRRVTAPPSSHVSVSKVAVDVEAVVVQVLKGLFGQEPNMTDDLASNGLDSIGGIELATTLKRELDIEEEVDMSLLATLPTPAAIVQFLRENFFTPNSTSQGASFSPTGQIKTLKSNDRAPALFLGAPAFGDGPLAYYKLTNALELGMHPCRTLERDVTEQPWPEVALEHAIEIMSMQSEGQIVVGGHSLGGLLAVETALAIERGGREVASIFLFDAPHPVQFKPDWNNIPTCDEDEESTGMTYMEVALTSFHFDTAAAGWSTLSKEERYDLFESVALQAVGRKFDARKLDEDISGGPYAAMWNSGMKKMDDGSIDAGAWLMLRGKEEPFRRVSAKVVHYRAGVESDALFEIELSFDDEILRGVSGYTWPLACDYVEVVRCRGSHMNLMTHEAEGGDLDETIVPHLRRALKSTWDDIFTGAKSRESASTWISRTWYRELNLWMSASPELQTHVALDNEVCNEPSESNAMLRVVDDLETFDQAAFGLNHLAWDGELASAQVWVVADLLEDISTWSHTCFASTLPCRAVHVPLRRLKGQQTTDLTRASIAARCVRAMRNASVLDRRFNHPVVVAAMPGNRELESIAFEIARQLNRRGEQSIAVVADKRGVSSVSTSPALHALELFADASIPDANRALRRAFASPPSKRLERARRLCESRRPKNLHSEAWRAEISTEISRVCSLFELARAAFHPGARAARRRPHPA